MATTNLDPQQIDQKYHFLLRKLHSLTGIVPIGVFLCEHMLTNSLAYGAHGTEKFNDSVHFLHQLPYLWALEVFGIFLPIAFHAIYGIKIAWSGQTNIAAYPHWDNRRYFLQRLTGYIAFVFIIIHLLKFRFAHLIGWGPEFVGSADPFEITRAGLAQWNIWGLVVPQAVTMTFYVIGLLAACFHFANGIWGFCISWGIALGDKARQRIGALAALVGIVLFVWGCLGLYAFAMAPQPGQPVPDSVYVEHPPPANVEPAPGTAG